MPAMDCSWRLPKTLLLRLAMPILAPVETTTDCSWRLLMTLLLRLAMQASI